MRSLENSARVRVGLVVCSALVAACSSSDTTPGDASADSSLPGCAITISPSGDDQTQVQTALIEVNDGGSICFTAGTYKFSNQLDLQGKSGITLDGRGATRDDVVLDFEGQGAGHDALNVKGDHFTIQNLTVKDAPGNGVKVINSDFPTFRKVKAFWSAGSVNANGAYALYPAECNHVLIEDCEVVGASDAGIYLGQSTTGIVRRNKAHGCVIGLEAENSTDVEIYENEAWDNVCGVLIVNLPNLVKKVTERVNAHDNVSHENNHENFGSPGAFVESVPSGTGMLIMAADNVEVHANELRGNGGTGLLVVSWPTLAIISMMKNTDAEYDQYTETTNVHDNVFTANGQAPTGVYPLVIPKGTMEDIIWDGVLDSTKPVATADQRKLCLRNNGGAPFRDLEMPNGLGDLTKQKTDVAPFDCTFPALAPITLP